MLYDEEGYSDMSTAWGPNQPNANLVGLLSEILPSTESWSDEIKIWGDQAKSDIQVGYEDNNVESVLARIDTRSDTLWICSKIVELARALDCCLFLLAARSIITADVAALSSAIHNSEAARFSAAPRAYIEQLSVASSRES
ncbi:hypothetical protein GN109_25310 [Collimonas pratensis]|uniref:hypothetical protein n=1 Tax=Collimonas pratensis TaxID=279113 RepID=UPI00143D31B1|nr:hypothetical protein [Collimonas pratensis]NKI72743.1 hypothetical protein [Collimonas pratensis]